MDRKAYARRTGTGVLLLLGYLFAIILKNSIFFVILSSTITLYAAYFLLKVSKRTEYYSINWLLFALTSITWGVADTSWRITSDILGMKSTEILLIYYLYLFGNILLNLSIIIYFFKNIKKWYNVQLVLDVVTTAIAVFLFLWQVLFKNQNMNMFLDNTSSFFVLYALIDVLTITIVFIMYSSSKKKNLNCTMKFIIASIVLFSFTDLMYTLSLVRGGLIEPRIIEFLYMTVFTLLGMSAIYELYSPSITYNPKLPNEYKDLETSKYPLLFLLLPTILYFANVFPFIILSIMIVMALVHQVLSGYVQRAYTNEKMLKKERQMNEYLEAKIAERTDELVRTNRYLEELVKKDTLTGLYNRRYFLEELDKLVEDKSNPFAILYMDLDRFKVINDTHGHEIGDRTLIAMAEILSKWKPTSTILARLGGDEVVLIEKERLSIDQLKQICEEIHDLFASPISIDSYKFHLRLSIGVVRFPIDAVDGYQLLKYADIAMYAAKKEPNGCNCSLYDSNLIKRIERKHEIEILLRTTNFDDEFQLYYQPQFNIHSGYLVGMEALLRWNSKTLGFISPGEFIPIAEEIGIIIDIGDWVMKKAVKQICIWNERFQRNLIMGINISPQQIGSDCFTTYIREILEIYGSTTEWIDLEVTESTAMKASTMMEEIFTDLSDLGVSISIDDFGTGYSSLSYIKRFDINRLKIAKELIDNIVNDKNELLIVKAIIMMAKGMNLTTIAEGVETENQLNFLKTLGCDEVQGYFLGIPMPATLFEENFLKN